MVYSYILNIGAEMPTEKNSVNQIRLLLEEQSHPGQHCLPRKLHGPSMFTVNAKIYGVLYKQSSSIAFVETSSY